MADRYVDRPTIADRLGLTERQITTLVKRGRLADGTEFPSRVQGRERTFPRERCLDWYIRYKQEEALQRAATKAPPGNLADAELRQAIADAELAELKLARLRGEVVPLEQYRGELRRILGIVRARLLNMPGEYASRLPVETALAVRTLREIGLDILAELQRAGGATIEDEADTEAEDAAA